MPVFDVAESKLLAVMYEGDKARDATSSIRGFLFQDYVTIMCLLDPKVKYVCSEFIEDVDVYYEDGRFKFIQVKYYPNSNPKMKEIVTDLYYQYLRFQLLGSKLTLEPCLFIHGKQATSKPDFSKVKSYLDGEKLPSTRDFSAIDNAEDWLISEVHKNNEKAAQKKALFDEMASEESLKEFNKIFQFVSKPNINQYRMELLQSLSAAFPNPDTNGKKQNWEITLLGLAVLYVQRRYTLNVSDAAFEELRIDKAEFDDYIKKSLERKTDATIVSYLVGIAYEKYHAIVAHNDLSDLEKTMLHLISRNTIKWIKATADHPSGQKQLLNTVSTEEADWLNHFEEQSVETRAECMMESKTAFASFLSYLWKIMLNICRERISSEASIPGREALFDPAEYICKEITAYVCLRFPEDRRKQSILLPSAYDDFSGAKRKIAERILRVNPRPEKWFMGNRNDLGRKLCNYDYSTANILDDTVANPQTGQYFYIECMECIKIEEGKWTEQENCNRCIFSERCAKGGQRT